jgi:arylsulfatase A-like enzyme
VARNLLVLFKPRLVAIVLQSADIAHGNFNGYADVVRQNDAAIGDLMKAIRADATLRDSTAVIACPEFGRDRDLNSRRGLDHGDGSEDLEFVSAVAWGPEFARDRVIEDDVRAVDLCPTVCQLLGTTAPRAKAKALPRLYA